MSINGDDTDLGPVIPATEARGGKAVNWDAVRPGEPLPPDQDSPETKPGGGA